MSRGDSGKKEGGEKKDITDKIVLTAYVVWSITSAKDCHRYSSR